MQKKNNNNKKLIYKNKNKYFKIVKMKMTEIYFCRITKWSLKFIWMKLTKLLKV